MLRRGGEASQRAAFAQNPTNGAPPPSTIAAQIVKNHDGPNQDQETEQSAPFGQLLKEILKDPSSIEDDPNVNAKLLSAVARRGLDVLQYDDPFNGDTRISEAVDSLLVIKVIVQRYPSLLLHSDTDENEAQRPCVFLWLIPKIVSLIGRSKYRSLQEDIQHLLSTFLKVIQNHANLPNLCSSFTYVYQTYCDGILDAFNNISTNILGSVSNFKAIVPLADGISKIWPESAQLVALPIGCQIPISSPTQALFVCIVVLGAIASTEFQEGQSALSRSSQQNVQLWAVEACTKTWSVYQSFRSYFQNTDSECTLEPLCLSTFETVCLPSSCTQVGSCFNSRRIAFLTRVYEELVQNAATETPAHSTQQNIAEGMIKLLAFLNGSRIREPGRQLNGVDLDLHVAQTLKDIFEATLSKPEVFRGFNNALRAAIYLWLSLEGNTSLENEYEVDRDRLFSDSGVSFESQDINKAFRRILKSYNLLKHNETSRSKRLKMVHATCGNSNEDIYERIVVRLGKNLELDDSHDISGVYSVIGDIFEQMVDDQRCDMLFELQTIACAACNTLQDWDESTNIEKNAICTVCDQSNISSDRLQRSFFNEGTHARYFQELLSLIKKLVKLPILAGSIRPRILITSLIRRLCNHTSDPDTLDLFQSVLGQWCLRSLTSSLRELRIAAGRSLTAFLRHDLPEKVLVKNKREIVRFLKELSEREALGEQETLILAWSQIARLCDEDELNLALLHLVECLGHPNSLICSIAFNELLSLSDAHQMSPAELFKPYWGIIGVTVTKDLQRCPQKAQQLADLLRMSVNQLLLLTQFDTIPFLVLAKRKDILSRIASARNPPASVRDIITYPKKTFAAVLALLLRQQSGDIENAVMALLQESAPEFADLDLQSLVNTDPPLIAFELLKATADADELTKNNVRVALQTLALLSENRRTQSRSSKKGKALGSFFERFILGIMAHFSMVIDSPREPQPLPERRRCVAAIREMIIIAKKQVSIGLPQIRACLQCAFDDIKLRDEAFRAWSCLIEAVDVEDLEQLIDQTLSTVAQYWHAFNPDTQTMAHELVINLFKERNELMNDRVASLPSLANIPVLSKIANDISQRKAALDVNVQYGGYLERLEDESTVVVVQALRELQEFLEKNQQFLHESAVSQKPSPVISQLARLLLDVRLRFNQDNAEIVHLCAQSLGILGCIDPNRIEAVREKKKIVVLSNFEREIEAIDFAAHLLEQVLVKCFHSAANARAQGFIAWAMQELLRFCKFNNAALQQGRSSQSPLYRRWTDMSEATRSTLTPFLSSSYSVQDYSALLGDEQKYPIFDGKLSHSMWLRSFTLDLLRKGTEGNARMIFTTIARIIRNHDLSIATFILPFAVLNVVLGGTDIDVTNIGNELLLVLEYQRQEQGSCTLDDLKQCSENVFQVLDYVARWLQDKRKILAEARTAASRAGRALTDIDEVKETMQMSSIERILHGIPAEVISRRAVECGSYARALFNWEQYIRQEKEKALQTKVDFDQESMYQHLQDIYAQIDEPDSIEGLSTHLHILDPAQQVLEHRKAGRWLTAQSWYELSLEETPEDQEVQVNLLTCLKESGQYESLLNYVDSFGKTTDTVSNRLLPFAAEAAWVTGKWDRLQRTLATALDDSSHWSQEFNVGVGKAFLALRNKDGADFSRTVAAIRESVVRGLSPATTASLQACHDHLLKLHVLYEIETISGLGSSKLDTREGIIPVLERRLDVLGAYTSDKQYLLGIRRAALQLSSLPFTKFDAATAWLTSAQLARKANFTTTAYNAALHSAQMGNDEARIEHSKLLWKDWHRRKAIQNLEGAIANKAFNSAAEITAEQHSMTMSVTEQQNTQNKVAAQAHLLLTKWLDQAGQTSSNEITLRYQNVIKSYARWDKGHYYLGKHYNKILEAEKALPRNKQSASFLAGEHAKLVIENFSRSLLYGSKYYYQTVPKILTLWLDLGMDAHEALKRPTVDVEINSARNKNLNQIHKQLQKYAVDRVPAYVFYTAFPQLITRISHPNSNVWNLLLEIILKVAGAHPQQALWSLLAVVKSTAPERAQRGHIVLSRLKERSKSAKREEHNIDIRNLILHGTKLTEALLHACEVTVDNRVSHVSLARDLNFNMKLAPCALVVPIESTMIASLPAVRDSLQIRKHKAFARDAVTIQSFEDSVLVLSSLQRPRKLTVRGSDGNLYGLLCKPKDDLRKDQRLMEFNGMINRALQRNVESSKRRLYIKTYGVTPLNEECGTIEWVDNLKPMRDVIIRLYQQKSVPINYNRLRELLNQACAKPPETTHIFTDDILGQFKPVLYEWFIETFPEPETWFSARLRYARSCAVMSIVGHILGLGDRHGENVLLEATTGGIFHVDFNCLFDKGLTFEKPELVPFRLTHNMVDAFGPCGVEGPFRIAAETTLEICRANMDTLLTILETFVWDPTADFIGRTAASKRGKRNREAGGVAADVPETPQEVLDSVRNKLRGLVRGDSVPLGVEGYVDALVKMARDQRNLAAMYIGWCAFF